MTQTLALRSDAEAEAERLRAVRLTSAFFRNRRPGTFPQGVPVADQVCVTTIRRSKRGPLNTSGAIFFGRVNVVDASGRVLEDLLVPVQVEFRASIHGKRRGDLKREAQEIHDRCQPAVIGALREHISTRLTNISDQSGHGLARALRREGHLARLLADEMPALVQAGLFDRRAVNEHESARSHETAASNESDARRRALQPAMLGITVRGPDIVLLLLVNATA
jgi:hypothetical protein